MRDKIPWLYTSFNFCKYLNSQFFHENSEISGSFFPTKFLVLMTLFSSIQLFKFVVVVFQVKNMLSRVKSQVRTSKIDQENLENLKSTWQEAADILPKVSSNVLIIAKENLLKRTRSMTEYQVFLLLFFCKETWTEHIFHWIFKSIEHQ